MVINNHWDFFQVFIPCPKELFHIRWRTTGHLPLSQALSRDVEAEAEAGSGSGGSGKFLWKRKLEAVNGYRFHLRCSTILALNVFLTQNKQLKHTITRVCEASCCRKYPLLNSQKFESTAVC